MSSLAEVPHRVRCVQVIATDLYTVAQRGKKTDFKKLIPSSQTSSTTLSGDRKSKQSSRYSLCDRHQPLLAHIMIAGYFTAPFLIIYYSKVSVI